LSNTSMIMCIVHTLLAAAGCTSEVMRGKLR